MANGHMETIIPSMFFKGPDLSYNRERLELSDGDFLDLDWLINPVNQNLMVISHGLEGSSDRYYVRRMADFFHQLGWDVLAWNCRSCSGEMNRLVRFYHHGETNDLAQVIDHGVMQKTYTNVVLTGSSMGGSMSIKYLGEQRKRPTSIKAAVTFSVPCNLRDSAEQLQLKSNRFYEKRFVKKLINKVKLKAPYHPEIELEGIDKIIDFDAFHERFTIPVYGFESMDEFYQKATCDQYLSDVEVPVLIINADNDPMLGVKCYPKELAKKSDQIYLEIPRVGGHVGFTIPGTKDSYMEPRTFEFLNSLGLNPREQA
jgi:predicted alpha/beta-fold hydrolase